MSNGGPYIPPRSIMPLPFRRRSGQSGVPLPQDRLMVVRPLTPNQVIPSHANLESPEEPYVDLTLLYPWIYPPRASYPISLANTAVTVNANSTSILVNPSTNPNAVIGAAYNGVITAFGCTAADLANMQWTILVRGTPVQPINAIQFQYGPFNQPSPIPGAGIFLAAGDDVQINGINVSGAGIASVQARADLYVWRVR